MTNPNVAVEVVKLGKQYRIGGVQNPQQTLRDASGQMLRDTLRAAKRLVRGRSPFQTPEQNIFWALRDVSVNVERGEVLGIIGRNGAGKSTLLKILTRITNPTEGYARIKGRVGSLLEVGTGFHPELSGRENAYMSGAILGMKRSEIDAKFDEIVAFSGVERFIDTPVKRYSSGMYLRLAFAVSAHLEPDVLLVDEVLAVGDVEFQKKCLGKMDNVAKEGRTVLFVSHNMNAVKHLCDTAIWLDDGQVRMYDQVDEVVDSYLGSVKVEAADQGVFPVMSDQHDIGFESCRVSLQPRTDDEALDLKIDLTVAARRGWPHVGLGFGLTTDTGVRVSWLGAYSTNHIFDMQPGQNHFVIECPRINRLLTAGDYVLSLWMATIMGTQRLVEVDEAAVISIPGIDLYGTGRPLEFRKHGPVALPLTITPVAAPEPAAEAVSEP
jgi:lipopolysaccharide transport system ATP-binding protein